MDDRAIRRERTQNLWLSFERKLPPIAKATQLDPEPQLSFDRIGGLAAAKEELLTYACAATHRDVYARWGTFPPSGLLLIGPGGCGKKLLAQALATRADTAFLRVDVPRLVLELMHTAGKVGDLLAGWSQTFEEMPPVTVLFDELEFSQAQELGGQRPDLPIGPVMDFLLELVDRTIADENSLVVGSTAHPDTLRRAFVSAGRFERVVEVSPSFPDDHVAALEIHAADAEKRAGRPLFDGIAWVDVVRGFREASTGEWVRILHAALRRKARCEAAGEPVKAVATADLLDEVERARRTHTQLPAARGIYL